MEGSPLFEGSNKYARHIKSFMKIVKDNMYDLKTMGLQQGGILTHFCSEVVSNMIVVGCTVSPAIVLIFNHIE